MPIRGPVDPALAAARRRALVRAGSVVAALTAGMLLPEAAAASSLIRPLVMVMLFFVFVEVRPSLRDLRASHAALIAATLLLAGFFGLLGGLVHPELGLAAFFAAVTPTAAAATGMARFLGLRPGYILAAFLTGNLALGLLFPFLLPWVVRLAGVAPPAYHGGFAGPGAVAWAVGSLLAVPWAAGAALRRVHPSWAAALGRRADLPFAVWLVVLVLAAAGARDSLARQPDLPVWMPAAVALVSAAVCGASFAAGRWLEVPGWRREAAQALGQKNTTLTLYLAYLTAGPVAALGPTCYVLWHNLYNAWQLSRPRLPSPPPPPD